MYLTWHFQFMMGVSVIIPWYIEKHLVSVLGSWYVSVSSLGRPDSHIKSFYFHVTNHRDIYRYCLVSISISSSSIICSTSCHDLNILVCIYFSTYQSKANICGMGMPLLFIFFSRVWGHCSKCLLLYGRETVQRWKNNSFFSFEEFHMRQQFWSRDSIRIP